MIGLSISAMRPPQLLFAGQKQTKRKPRKPNSVFYNQATLPTLQTFVEDGFVPLRAGNYEQVRDYYLGPHAKQVARKTGIKLSTETVGRQVPKTLQGARHQWEQSVNGSFGEIKRFRFVPTLSARFPVYTDASKTTKYITRGVAYMLAEEWSHGIQYKSKRPLTHRSRQFLNALGLLGRLNPNDEQENLCDLANEYGTPIQRPDFVALFEDTYGKKLARDMKREVAFLTMFQLFELDLALYFIEKKVPVTKDFLMEYNRRRLIDTSEVIVLSDQLSKLSRIPKPIMV